MMKDIWHIYLQSTGKLRGIVVKFIDDIGKYLGYQWVNEQVSKVNLISQRSGSSYTYK